MRRSCWLERTNLVVLQDAKGREPSTSTQFPPCLSFSLSPFHTTRHTFFLRLQLPLKLVVLAEDDAVHGRLQAYARRDTMSVRRTSLPGSGTDSKRSYNDTAYNSLVSTRAKHILQLLPFGNQGRHSFYY